MLQGNASRRPLPQDEPAPPVGPVKAPPWLDRRGRRAWRWLAPVLEQMRVLSTADPHALALLCDAYAEYIDARAVVREKGQSYESMRRDVEEAAELDENGHVTTKQIEVTRIIIRPRPEVAIASDAWRRVMRMLLEFGLTPASRSRLQAAPSQEEDPFEEFLDADRRSR